MPLFLLINFWNTTYIIINSSFKGAINISDTDYVSKFKLDYPVAYIPPGQHEAYQQVCSFIL